MSQTTTRTAMSQTTAGSEGRLWIRASPRGKRSGFAVLPDGQGGRLTVTVQPKPWAPRHGQVREYEHTPGTTTHLVVHETDLAAVRTSTSAKGALAVSLADVGRSQDDLLSLTAAPQSVRLTSASPEDPFGALIDLMLLTEHGNLTTSPLSFEGALGSSLLRLLTHERLLQAVESLIFRARPRYAEHTQILTIPRGRLSERSLLLSIASGTPHVESTFDELTMDTPLLRVITSALRVVASERLPRKISVLRPGLQTRANHLLRHLSSVTPISREQAALAGDRLWLTPLDRIWEPAIDSAMPVLREQAVIPEDGAESNEAFIVHIAMEKFWEQCLELALASAFPSLAVSRDGRPGEGVMVPAPWAPKAHAGGAAGELSNDGFPDFMFRSSGRVVVADAKYKLDAGAAPGSQDAYQMFAYSHIATLNGNHSDVAVVLYPTRSGGDSRQMQLERLPSRDYPLWMVRVPFPARTDLQNRGRWSAYVARLTREVLGYSTAWTRRLDGASVA